MRVIGEVEARLDRMVLVDEAKEAQAKEAQAKEARPHAADDIVKFALLKREVDLLIERVDTQQKAILDLRKERDRALIWGILALGSVLFSIAVWAINFVIGHSK